MAGDVRLVIYDSGIAAMSLPGGAIWRWARQRSVRVERTAKAFAPIRTGELRRSIYATYEPSPPKEVIMEVHATAYYAQYVHEGTFGPILPRSGKFLKFKGRDGHNVYARSVSGQRPQPFLTDALLLVMADL